MKFEDKICARHKANFCGILGKGILAEKARRMYGGLFLLGCMPAILFDRRLKKWLQFFDLNILKPGLAAVILQGNMAFLGGAVAGSILPFARGFFLLPLICP